MNHLSIINVAQVFMDRWRRIVFLLIGISMNSFAFADLPPDPNVVQAVPVSLQNSPIGVPSTVDVQVLQQQVNNLNQMDLPGQIQRLQQNISDLRGMVEMQGHQIQELQKQIAAGASNNATAIQEAVTAPVATTAPVAQASAAPAVAPTVDAEKNLYETAFQNIAAKNYSRAMEGMQAYLNHYPQGKYAPNAHYWLGELYAVSGNNDQATVEFQTVLTQFKDSPKVAESMLKLGLMAEDANNQAQAQAWFTQIVKNYPNSSAADIANQHLQKAQAAR